MMREAGTTHKFYTLLLMRPGTQDTLQITLAWLFGPQAFTY